MDFLVVDPNIAFATLLQQELSRMGHRVALCTSGDEALAAARQRMPELAVLDMALEQPDAITLARELRDLNKGVRLMLIPLLGDQLILGEDAPPIQGLLTKPFFMPELPAAIQAALDAPLSDNGHHVKDVVATSPEDEASPDTVPPELEELLATADADASLDESLAWLAELDAEPRPTPPPPPLAQPDQVPTQVPAPTEGPPPLPETSFAPSPSDEPPSLPERVDVGPEPHAGFSLHAFRINQGRIEFLMRQLAADVGADGVLLTSDPGLLTAVGNLDESEIESISVAVLQGVRTSAEVARILGREQLRFEQSIAGGSYMLYALSVHDAILAVTVSGDTALGLLRLSARSTAESIAELCIVQGA